MNNTIIKIENEKILFNSHRYSLLKDQINILFQLLVEHYLLMFENNNNNKESMKEIIEMINGFQKLNIDILDNNTTSIFNVNGLQYLPKLFEAYKEIFILEKKMMKI